MVHLYQPSPMALRLLGLLLVLRQTGKIKLKWKSAFAILILKKVCLCIVNTPYVSVLLFRCSMLERIHPNDEIETASYAQGYRFFMAANMIGYLFAGLLLPLFQDATRE